MADLLTTISSSLAAAKELYDLSKTTKNDEVKVLIADIMSQLADAKVQVGSLLEENTKLKQQIISLQTQPEKVDVRSELESREGLYWRVKPKAGKPKGPFCPKCLDNQNAIILLGEQTGHLSSLGRYRCMNCNGFFGEGRG